MRGLLVDVIIELFGCGIDGRGFVCCFLVLLVLEDAERRCCVDTNYCFMIITPDSVWPAHPTTCDQFERTA